MFYKKKIDEKYGIKMALGALGGFVFTTAGVIFIKWDLDIGGWGSADRGVVVAMGSIMSVLGANIARSFGR